MNKKSVLIAFDGTGNSVQGGIETPGTTNVARLANSYGGKVIYIPGVGTNKLSVLIGGATGAGGAIRLESAYKDLGEYMEENGDVEIDVIGFSRGAALARTFTNLLISRGDPRDYWPGKKRGRGKTGSPISVRFLGIFDTVGSFGIPGDDSNLGHNFSIPESTQTVRHAIAIHENRDTFPLTSIQEGIGIEKKFPGAHSDVGGGYEDGIELSLFPLSWMSQEGIKAGVPFETFSPPQQNGPGPNGEYLAHNSGDELISWKNHNLELKWWEIEEPNRKVLKAEEALS